MTVSTAVLDELRGIVGPRHYTDDPAILDTYRYSLTHTANHLGPWYGSRTPRGAAVVLPGTWRRSRRSSASATGSGSATRPARRSGRRRATRPSTTRSSSTCAAWTGSSTSTSENLFAVVEPGVIAATLQAETMKVGLNTHIPGVGCSSSILAGATSYFGSGPSNLYGGHHFDNLMAMEWVTPDRRPGPDRLRGRRPRLVQRRGPRPVDARRRPRLSRVQGRHGRLHQVLREALPVAGSGDAAGHRRRPGLPG